MSDDDLDDIPPEIDFTGAMPNKYAARILAYGHSVTLIDKDGSALSTEYFPPPGRKSLSP